MRFLTTALLSGLALIAHMSHAHHSRANFQLDNLVEMRGTVTEFHWSNPHIYWEMALDNGETWLIEGHSIPGVLRIGWTRETVQVGDEIHVAAFPDQNEDRQFALVEWLVTADGVPMAGFNPRAIPSELRAGANRPPLRGFGPSTQGTEPSMDFSGNWRIDMRGVNLRTGALFEPSSNLPLTAAGEAVMAAYDEAENPSYQCVQASLPISGPYGIRIDRLEDRLTIQREHGGGDGSYTIWLDESSAPTDQRPNRLGVATGRMEDDNTIVFEITSFVADKWGLARGLDSSDEKHVSGRLELEPDGRSIRYSFVISDPVYLTEPIEQSGVMFKEPDRAFVNEPCDPEISSLHLTEE